MTGKKVAVHYTNILILLVNIIIYGFGESQTFRAAVYEHAVISGPAVTRVQALSNMRDNLMVFQQQMAAAKSQGVELIVFPEYGLTGRLNPETRYTATLYGERIPEVGTEGSCLSCDETTEGSQITQALSSAAREHQMYVVANLIEKIALELPKSLQDCSDRQILNAAAVSNIGLNVHVEIGQLPTCSGTSRTKDYLLYNTNVIINSSGCIVAKYHKYSLFSKEGEIFDHPPKPEYAYVDTPFGRIGTLICFDLVFLEPGVKLVEQYKVDTIVYPTYWTMMNTSMTLYNNIVEYSSGWARRMNVNFLAANIRNHRTNSFGSAISTPNGIKSMYYQPENKEGKLLIADLEKSQGSMTNQDIVQPMRRSDGLDILRNLTADFDYQVVRLTSDSNFKSVCHNSVCCQLTYNYTVTDPHRLQVLAAYSSRHSSRLHTGPIHFELCLFQTCRDNSLDSCFQYPITETFAEFSQFRLSGQFSSDHVFPTLSGPNYNFNAVEWDFHHEGKFNEIIVHSPNSAKILNAAMIAPF